MNTLRQDQRGSALIVILVVVLAVLIGLVLVKVSRSANTPAKNDSHEQTSQQTEEGGSGDDGSTQSTDTGDSLARNQRNTARRNDAAILASATLEYVANNSGLLPRGFEDGKFTNYELGYKVAFGFYKTTTVESGDYPAINKDQIVLVTQASCGPDKEAVESSSRSAAVLYALESNGGRWDAACLDV